MATQGPRSPDCQRLSQVISFCVTEMSMLMSTSPSDDSPLLLEAYDENYHRALSELWLLLDESIHSQVLSFKTGPAALWRALFSRFASLLNPLPLKSGAVATLARHGPFREVLSNRIPSFFRCVRCCGCKSGDFAYFPKAPGTSK